MKHRLTSLRTYFTRQFAIILLVTMSNAGCPVSYDSHDEWNCTAAKDAKPCISSVDCNSDKLECRAGYCLDKKPPSHSICASDGFFKPASQGCLEGEFLCSQYCVPEDLLTDFGELCCLGACGDDEECCLKDGAPGCVAGGCNCVDRSCPLGATCCGGDCPVLSESDTNCGACFHACPAERPICFDSVCVDGRSNACCGSECVNCELDQQVCLDGFCQDCTDSEQCEMGQDCIEQFHVDSAASACITHLRCRSPEPLAAQGEDCQEQACAEGLVCIRRAIADLTQFNFQCLPLCVVGDDCLPISGTTCHQLASCSGYCE